MNRKQAIAYAQITLDSMQSSKYSNEITPENFGIEMKQAFKLYSLNIVTNIADAQMEARRNLRIAKTGSDIHE